MKQNLKDKLTKTLQETGQSTVNIVPTRLSSENIVTQGVYNANLKVSGGEDDVLILKDRVETVNEIVIRESLNTAVERQHIDLFMQPIVTLPQRHVTFFEFFGRLRVLPGQYLPAQNYLHLAGEEKMVNALDTIFLKNCLRVIEKQRDKVGDSFGYFINLRPHTLRHHGFMDRLLGKLRTDQALAQSLIFEMRHNDFLVLSPAERKILEGLSQIGCRFSVDHVAHLPSDIRYLRLPRIDFIKVEAKTLIRDGRSEAGFSETLRRKYTLDVNNITMIVEKTEKEHELKEILDFDISYGQGYLFGRPDFQGVYTL
ncbi:MAG: EAL domain-containing protein [Alphaproteobacteria bacterium]|nr:EAL domain-containing protein [Alphaproteobacteria bacterium]